MFLRTPAFISFLTWEIMSPWVPFFLIMLRFMEEVYYTRFLKTRLLFLHIIFHPSSSESRQISASSDRARMSPFCLVRAPLSYNNRTGIESLHLWILVVILWDHRCDQGKLIIFLFSLIFYFALENQTNFNVNIVHSCCHLVPSLLFSVASQNLVFLSS